jgi:hypothetical protein
MAEPRFVNVFLDAQVFVAKQFDFSNTTFEVLRSRVAAGHIHVFSTEVTRREVERHVKARAARLHEKLESVRRDSLIRHLTQPPFEALHRAPTREDVEAALLGQLADCWNSLRVNTLSIKDTSVSAVLDDYFNVRPPFSKKKNKEFPDAFAAQALQSWCKANAQSIHVISEDGDWRAVCDAIPELIYTTELADILKDFPDAVISKAVRGWVFANDAAVKDAIVRAFRDYLFFGKKWYDRELRTVDVTRVRIDEAYVIQADKGAAAIQITCKIAYAFMTVRTEAPDIHYLITHGEPEATYKGRSKTKAVAEFAVRYDEANPGNVTVESVSIALRRSFAATTW